MEELRSKLRRFLVADLKAVLRNFQLNLFGLKADLFERIMGYANLSPENLSQVTAFVTNHYQTRFGFPPPRIAHTMPNAHAQHRLMTPTFHGTITPHRAQIKNQQFRFTPSLFENSLFYDSIKVVKVVTFGSPVAVMNQRHFESITFDLTEQEKDLLGQVDPVTKKKIHNLQAVCGEIPLNEQIPVKLSYPSSANLTFNQKPIPLRKYSKSREVPIPADLGDGWRLTNNAACISYFGRIKPSAIFIRIVKAKTDQDIENDLRSKNFITKEDILKSRGKKSGDDDLVAGNETISLMDPLTRARIKTPIRSKLCSHKQCFDAGVFFAFNRTSLAWDCPVCCKVLSPSMLFVDGYMDDILKNISQDVDSITIKPDGTWSLESEAVPKEECKDSNQSIVIELDDDLAIIESSNFPPPSKQKSRQSSASSQPATTLKKQEVILISDSDDDYETRILESCVQSALNSAARATSVAETPVLPNPSILSAQNNLIAAQANLLGKEIDSVGDVFDELPLRVQFEMAIQQMNLVIANFPSNVEGSNLERGGPGNLSLPNINADSANPLPNASIDNSSDSRAGPSAQSTSVTPSRISGRKTGSPGLPVPPLHSTNMYTPKGQISLDRQATTNESNATDSIPANGETDTPANGETETPANGGTVTPANGEAVTPANGGTHTNPSPIPQPSLEQEHSATLNGPSDINQPAKDIQGFENTNNSTQSVSTEAPSSTTAENPSNSTSELDSDEILELGRKRRAQTLESARLTRLRVPNRNDSIPTGIYFSDSS